MWYTPKTAGFLWEIAFQQETSMHQRLLKCKKELSSKNKDMIFFLDLEVQSSKRLLGKELLVEMLLKPYSTQYAQLTASAYFLEQNHFNIKNTNTGTTKNSQQQ